MEYAPTAHNRTVSASPPVGGSGYGLPRSFRYAPFPLSDCRVSGIFAPAQFVGPENAPHFLIRAAKPSHTARRYAKCRQKLYQLFKIIDKIKA
jgi:hypothetical protein